MLYIHYLKSNIVLRRLNLYQTIGGTWSKHNSAELFYTNTTAIEVGDQIIDDSIRR